MVLGLKTKNQKSGAIQVDYLIHLQEIKPWPPSQSLRSLRSVFIQWEHGERNSGSTNQVVPSLGSGSESGRIEFDESFRLSVTLQREMSVRGGDSYTFQKNCLEFNLYEPRRDKGQLLGSVIVNLADYGIIKEGLSISAPMNCKRSVRNTAQPILFLKIQPVEKIRNRSISMERSVGESVSALMNEEYAEEAEDDVSSHSSTAVSSSTIESNTDSPSRKDANGSKVMKGIQGDDKDDQFAFDSKQGLAKSDSKPLNEPHSINLKKTSRNSSSTDLSSDFEIQEHIQSKNLQSSLSSIAYEETDEALNDNTEIKEGMKEMVLNNGIRIRSNGPFVKITSSHTEDKRVKDNEVNSRRSNGFVSNERKEAKLTLEETRRLLNERKVQVLEQRVQMLEGELREAAAIEVSLYSVVAEHGSSISKVHAPARRLSRLYFHFRRVNLRSRTASAAKSAVSGLVLAAKACGHDVPRLTFWLSNCIVLRGIITQDSEERASNGKQNTDRSSLLKWKDSSRSTETMRALHESFDDWEETHTFTSALEKIESWIFSRIVESVWWQTLTPYMQSDAAKKSSFYSEEHGNFSIEIWKNALRSSCERICPIRAGGHVCGCLPLISRLIMEECVGRLDVAMFNAILRESADEIPTDPVSDPISDPRVLPIPPGKSSFGAGAQLKNAIGNWTRWLSDVFGIDENDPLKDYCNKEVDDNYEENEEGITSFKPFYLLTALSDLMMLPKDMLLSRSIRKEVCPTFGASLIKRIINTFEPDEFCPDPIPPIVLESLDSVLDDASETSEDSFLHFPCRAASIIYRPPSTNLLGNILRDGGKSGSHLTRSGSLVLRKSYTSDDELDELDSPLTSIVGSSLDLNSSVKLGWILKGNGRGNDVRFQLLRDVWVNSEL